MLLLEVYDIHSSSFFNRLISPTQVGSVEGSCFSLLPDSPPGGIWLGVATPVNQAAGLVRVGLTEETGAAVPLKRLAWAQVRARGGR